MRVVLDTNVLLQARAAGHAFHPILRAWFDGKIVLALSTEILLEYEEVITERTGLARWQMLARLLSVSPHVHHVAPTYRFHLVTHDPDDDKFTDCAIVAQADYVITSDHHFCALIGSGYQPQPITPEEFIQRHLT